MPVNSHVNIAYKQSLFSDSKTSLEELLRLVDGDVISQGMVEDGARLVLDLGQVYYVRLVVLFFRDGDYPNFRDYFIVGLSTSLDFPSPDLLRTGVLPSCEYINKNKYLLQPNRLNCSMNVTGRFVLLDDNTQTPEISLTEIEVYANDVSMSKDYIGCFKITDELTTYTEVTRVESCVIECRYSYNTFAFLKPAATAQTTFLQPTFPSSHVMKSARMICSHVVLFTTTPSIRLDYQRKCNQLK